MRKPYEGNASLNQATYLDAYPDAKAEAAAALKFFTNANREPNSETILRTKGLDYYRHPQNEVDSCLAYEDESGDLRFLDRIYELMVVAHGAWVTEFILKPDGTRAGAWANNPDYNKPGYKRWLYLYAELTPNTPDSFYGTDLGPGPLWRWHGVYATVALALKNNIGKASPKGYDYSAMFNIMQDYLLNHFEPLWKARGVVRSSGQTGAGAINIGSPLQRSAISRARYHRAMYLMFGGQTHLDMANLASSWALDAFETKSYSGKSFIHWPTTSPRAQADAGGSTSQPQSFEQTRLAAPTITGAAHLHIMGQSGFTPALLTGMANMLYHNALIDGPTGAPSGDIGGGGAATLGKTKAERQFIKMRNGDLVPSSFYLTEYDDKPNGRWVATEALVTAMFLVAEHGDVVLKNDVQTFRNRFDSLSGAKYLGDKVALALYHLTAGGWERDPAATPDPGPSPTPTPTPAPTPAPVPKSDFITPAQALVNPYAVQARVLVGRTREGELTNLSAFKRTDDWTDRRFIDWVDSLELSADIDQPTSSVSADLNWRDGDVVIAPLLAPTKVINLGFYVRIELRSALYGTAWSSWALWWEGYIDSLSPDKTGRMPLKARDLGSVYVDHFMNLEEPDLVFGSDNGTPLVFVIKDILKRNGFSIPPMGYTPGTTIHNFPIKETQQERTTVMLAFNAFANQAGGEMRMLLTPEFNAVNARYRLTFRSLDLQKTDPDFRFSEADIIDVSPLEQSRQGIRNSVAIVFGARRRERRRIVEVDQASIAEYGLIHMEVHEDSSSQIDTPEEAIAMARAILADVARPKADLEVTIPFWPWLRLGDLVQLSDLRYFPSAYTFAVTGYTHRLVRAGEDLELRTVMRVRGGKPALQASRWLRYAEAGRKLGQPKAPFLVPRPEAVQALWRARIVGNEVRYQLYVNWKRVRGNAVSHYLVRFRDVTLTVGVDQGAESDEQFRQVPVYTTNWSSEYLVPGTTFEVSVATADVESRISSWSDPWFVTIRGSSAQTPPPPVEPSLPEVPTDPTDPGTPTDPDLPTGPDPTPLPIGNLTLAGDPNFTAASLEEGSELRRVFDKAAVGHIYIPNAQRIKNQLATDLKWEEKYKTQRKTVTVESGPDKGETYPKYTGPDAGAFFFRSGTKTVYSASLGGRATTDLKWLDAVCEDAFHITTLTTLLDGDEVFMAGPSAHSHLFYGTADGKKQGPQKPENTATIMTRKEFYVVIENGKEVVKTRGEELPRITYLNQFGGNENRTAPYTNVPVKLENGLIAGGLALAAWAAWQNRDKFSPTFEPVGNRPATPAYYLKVATACVRVVDSIRKQGEGGGLTNYASNLMHSALGGVLTEYCLGRIRGGANYEQNDHYKLAVQAYNALLGPAQEVGATAGKKGTWYYRNHPTWGDCYVWSHNPETRNAGKAPYPHPHNYTDHDAAILTSLFLDGAPFVKREMVEGFANTLVATCLKSTFKYFSNQNKRSVLDTRLPYFMHGNNDHAFLKVPTGWEVSASDRGVGEMFFYNNPLGILAPFDKNGVIEEYLEERFASSAYSKYDFHLQANLLLNYAVRGSSMSP